MDANLSPSVIAMGDNLWRKVFYIIGAFAFFPLAWLNHFRLLPGSALFHYIGFLVLIGLSIFIMNRLDDDYKVNNGFVIKIENINLVILCLNIIMYITAWTFVGGPAFKFFGQYGWIPRLSLLIGYIVLLGFNLMSPMMKLYIGCWDDEYKEHINKEASFSKRGEPA